MKKVKRYVKISNNKKREGIHWMRGKVFSKKNVEAQLRGEGLDIGQ